MSDSLQNPARGWKFWLALALVLLLFACMAMVVIPRLRIETNLLALLPSTAENQVQLGAVRRFAERSSRELVFVVGTSERAKLRAAGLAFTNALEKSGAFARIDYLVDDRYIAAARAERKFRSVMLSARHRDQLVHGDTTSLERESLRAAFTPLGMIRPFGIADDPLGIASAAFTEALPGAGRARLDGDILIVAAPEADWAVVRAATAGDPYRTETQRAVIAAIDAGRDAALKVAGDARIDGSGVILHAAAAASKAQDEISIFGGIDLAAVVLLIVLVFRMLRPLLFTLATLAVATCAAIAACQYAFGQVHILTLTFGTSLIGVSVDYSLHYFVNRMRDGAAKPHDITPALMLGCTTAVAGYLSLLIAPIPGLRQIALFSAVGLVVACAIVILLYPGLDRRPMPRSVPAWVTRFASAHVETLLPRAVWWVLLLLLVGATILGIARLKTRDDVRALQRPPPALVASEARVRALLGVEFDTRFVLVTAPTPEQVLQRLETLHPTFVRLVATGKIRGFMSPSPSLASQSRQRADRALLEQQVYSRNGALERVMRRLGFDENAVTTRTAAFAAARDQLFTPSLWLASPLSAPVRHLWLGELGKSHAAVVLLDRTEAPAAVRAAVESVPGVFYVDQVADISRVLGDYRRIAGWLMIVVLAVMVACLLVFYRNRVALLTAIPAAAGLAFTLATLGLIHEPINLFHVLSLLLVLGLGVDYAIILREGRSLQALLAVFLSMTATLISFGLLGFSSVAFVRSIGITVALGVAFTFLIAVAARPRRTSEHG
jgi:predicted exporter